MTLEIVQARLDKLITSETPKVAMLTGDWGSGKTYQWKQALKRAAQKKTLTSYAYVSLFGLTSLAEVRKRITEEIISTIRLPNRGTVEDEITSGSIGLKPLQIIKILPVIPYLAKLESLAQELSFTTVRNAIICIDDLERAHTSLRVADVLGLASFLKEERNCRVLLISNQKKLCSDTRSELDIYLEKVVEESIDFAPSPEEACAIALGANLTKGRKILADRVIHLGVSNIRVITRLGVLTDDLITIVNELHPNVLSDAINTLALFGIAHFIPQENFPTIKYLIRYGNSTWDRYLRHEKREEDQTKQDKLEADWDKLIIDYGYGMTSPLDKEIYAGIVSGFFNEKVIFNLSKEFSQQIEDGNRRKAFDDAGHRFWWGVDDSEAAFQQLFLATKNALDLIKASDIYNVYITLINLDRQDDADNLLDQFIIANQDRRGALKLNKDFGETYVPTFESILDRELERLEEPIDLEKTLDAIDFHRGWNSNDLVKIAAANFNDIVPLLTSATDSEVFARRLTTLLKFGENGNTAEEKNVREKTIAWLKTVAATDPISNLRVKRFLPVDPPS